MRSKNKTPKIICRNPVCLDNIVFNLFQILSDETGFSDSIQCGIHMQKVCFFVNKVQRIGKQKQQK